MGQNILEWFNNYTERSEEGESLKELYGEEVGGKMEVRTMLMLSDSRFVSISS